MTTAYQPSRESGELTAAAGWGMSATTWGGRGSTIERSNDMSESDVIALFILVIAAIELGYLIGRKK